MGEDARGRVTYTYTWAMGGLRFTYLKRGKSKITERRTGLGNRSMYQVRALYFTLIRVNAGGVGGFSRSGEFAVLAWLRLRVVTPDWRACLL